MSFSFEPGEPPADGVRRIVNAELASAIARLSAPADADAAIHDVRKQIKRVRAVLRLARHALPPGVYEEEAAALRDAALRLGGARDAKVLLDTFDALRSDVDALDAADARRIHALLSEDYAAACHPADAGRLRGEAAAFLGLVRRRCAGWTFSSDGWALVGQGLRDGYRRCRRRLRKAEAAGTAKAFHDWRKAVKCHWHHVELIAPACPALLGALGKELRRLSALLGDEHDLAVLEERLGSQGLLPPPLAVAMRKRQEAFRRAALSSGRQCLADSAGAFLSRVAAWWRLWTAGA